MTCTRCQHLAVHIDIKLPSDLKKAIAVAKRAVAEEVVQEVEAERMPYGEPFENVEEGGPWGDVLHYCFRCQSCQQRFSLGAETYHGRGGEWTIC